MEYQLKYKKSVEKDFHRIPREQVRVLKKKIDECLKTNPFRGRPLKGRFKGMYRIRIGSYRVIYQIQKEEVVVLILRVSHRKDIYRGILR